VARRVIEHITNDEEKHVLEGEDPWTKQETNNYVSGWMTVYVAVT